MIPILWFVVIRLRLRCTYCTVPKNCGTTIHSRYVFRCDTKSYRVARELASASSQPTPFLSELQDLGSILGSYRHGRDRRGMSLATTFFRRGPGFTARNGTRKDMLEVNETLMTFLLGVDSRWRCALRFPRYRWATESFRFEELHSQVMEPLYIEQFRARIIVSSKNWHLP